MIKTIAKGKTQVVCPACKTPIELEVPAGEIINTPQVSMAVWPHPKRFPCSTLGCEAYFMMMVVDIAQTAIAWSPVPPPVDEPEKSLIVTPNFRL